MYIWRDKQIILSPEVNFKIVRFCLISHLYSLRWCQWFEFANFAACRCIKRWKCILMHKALWCCGLIVNIKCKFEELHTWNKRKIKMKYHSCAIACSSLTHQLIFVKTIKPPLTHLQIKSHYFISFISPYLATSYGQNY